ncbi:hypothetical protein FRC19_006872 [Serendipita sp. 401]|nr:hypothetical protein FRC19_006872 [Serendipita sp. 401]
MFLISSHCGKERRWSRSNNKASSAAYFSFLPFIMKAIFTAVILALPYVSAIAEWAQCGGIGWTGSGSCNSGLTCVVINSYYYQCQKGSGGGGGTTAPPPQTTSGGGGGGGGGSTGNLSAKFKAKGKKYWGTASDSALLSNSQNSAVIKAQCEFSFRSGQFLIVNPTSQCEFILT